MVVQMVTVMVDTEVDPVLEEVTVMEVVAKEAMVGTGAIMEVVTETPLTMVHEVVEVVHTIAHIHPYHNKEEGKQCFQFISFSGDMWLDCFKSWFKMLKQYEFLFNLLFFYHSNIWILILPFFSLFYIAYDIFHKRRCKFTMKCK